MTPALIALLIALAQSAPAQSAPATEPAPTAAPPPQSPPPPAAQAPAPASAPASEPSEEGEAQGAAQQPLPVSQESPLETLTRSPSVRPFVMPSMTPLTPIPYGALPDVVPTAPVVVEKYSRSYEPPKDSIEQYYDRGIQGAYQAEQSMMGTLDGLWSINTPEGQPIFTLVLNDPPGGVGLEGAWRDLRRGSDAASIGVIDRVSREGQSLLLQFHGGDRIEPTILHLRREPDGRWRGDLDDAGQKMSVTMARSAGPT